MKVTHNSGWSIKSVFLKNSNHAHPASRYYGDTELIILMRATIPRSLLRLRKGYSVSIHVLSEAAAALLAPFGYPMAQSFLGFP